MRLKLSSIVAALFLWVLPASPCSAQYNPGGWIRTDGWNMLFLSQRRGCAAGGTTAMRASWTFPHDIGREDPKAGDVWGDIAFGGEALSTGGFGDPRWLSVADLETGNPGVLFDRADTTDLVAWISTANGTGLRISPTEVLMLATTYVENMTGAPLPVDIVSSSDDSSQVWLNDVVVTNVSACRGVEGGQETSAAVLPQGVSKIAILVWQQWGAFAFRLGIQRKTGGAKYTDTDSLTLRFLGPGGPETQGQYGYRLTRSMGIPLTNVPYSDPVPVHLEGVGPGSPGDLLTVVEEITAERSDKLLVTDVSDQGVVASIPPPSGPVGEFAGRCTIGSPCGASSNTSYDSDAQVYTSIAETGGDIWDGPHTLELAYNYLEGDFDVAIRILDRSHSTGQGRWGKFGIMARESLSPCARYTFVRDNLPNPPDDPWRLEGRLEPPESCSGSFESQLQTPTLPSNHPTYLRLTRRGSVIHGWASDDPAVEDDPTEDSLWIEDPSGADWGLAAPERMLVGFGNSEHYSEGCAVQTVQFKVVHMEGAASGEQSGEQGKFITWAGIPRSVVNSGLSYKVQYTSHGRVTLDARIAEEMGAVPVTELYFDESMTGPVGAFDNSLDIGWCAAPGSLSYQPDTDTYTLASSGCRDIGNGGDHFRYAFKDVTGDFVATARIVAVSGWASQEKAKMGLMARYSLDPLSKYSMAVVPLRGSDPLNNYARRHQYRRTHLQDETILDDLALPAGACSHP